MTRIRRWGPWWAVAILALTVAGGIVGSVVSRDIQPTYAATASMLVGDLRRPDLAGDVGASAMVTAIYGNLIRSESVLDPVIRRLDLPTDWQELRDRVHVDLGANEIPIITITVYGGSTADATATAGAITDRLLELSQSSLGAPQLQVAPNTSSDQLLTERSITKAERRLSKLETKATSMTGSDRRQIQGRIDRLSGGLMSWQDIYGSQLAANAGSANDLQLLQPAEPKGGRIRPRVVVNVALGAAIGCLLGFVLLISRGTIARRRDVVPGVNDPWVRELTGSPQA